MSELARAKGRRDEAPNVELATRIAAHSDARAVAELVQAMVQGPPTAKGDAVKVLYEVGARDPELIAPHQDQFFAALSSRNNRLVWGALAALDAIAAHDPGALAKRILELIQAGRSASVIARDMVVSILCKLTGAGFAKTTVRPLLGLLRDCADNQFPMYAEKIAAVLPESEISKFRAQLEARMETISQASKHARVERVLRRLARSRSLPAKSV